MRMAHQRRVARLDILFLRLEYALKIAGRRRNVDV
jgi:hypothetical protein